MVIGDREGLIHSIAVGNGALYWISYDKEEGTRIRRAKLDGSEPTDLVKEIKAYPSMIVTDDSIYWISYDSILGLVEPGTVWRANLDGSDVSEIMKVETCAYKFVDVVGKQRD